MKRTRIFCGCCGELVNETYDNSGLDNFVYTKNIYEGFCGSEECITLMHMNLFDINNKHKAIQLSLFE